MKVFVNDLIEWAGYLDKFYRDRFVGSSETGTVIEITVASERVAEYDIGTSEGWVIV